MTKIKSIFFLFALLAVNAAIAGDTKEFEVEGIKVIHKYVPKDVIAVRLFLEGGTANYTKEKQGVEDLTLSLMVDGGTTSMSKLEFNAAAEKIGTRFGSNTNLDYGTISMTCIKTFWDDSWKLFADAVLHPAFSENEFNLAKERSVADAQQTMADPDSYLAYLSRTVAFENKDYAKSPTGTPETLSSLTLEDVKNYYSHIIGKKRIFVVVVGNVTEEDITNKIKESLAKLPYGIPAPKEERTIITQPKSYVEDRDIATNYIRGIFSAPMANTDEGVAMRIAIAILGDRYFTELRTKRSLSYAPAAFYAQAAVTNPYSVIYISTIDPKQSMQVMVDELNKIKREGFTQEELDDKKQEFLTGYYLTLETTGSMADALGMAEMNGGWEQLDNVTDEVNKTTLAMINKVFDKFSAAIVWTYLGKKEQVATEDFKQTEEVPKKSKPY